MHELKKQTRYRVPLAAILLLFLLLLVQTTAFASAALPSGFTETTVALFGQNAFPTDMAFTPDGRMLVTNKYGQLRVIKNGALLATPFLTVSTNGSNERGLLGVAVDPNFASNHFVYIYYTVNTAPIHNRVSRFTANGDVAVAGSEVALMDLEAVTTSFHNAGTIGFGTDGKLYIAVGNDNVNSNSQSLSNRLGKILRINKDGSIPTDNPFYNTAGGANRSIWTYGLRNPFKFAVQPGTGRLWINDVGFEAWEEINNGVAGANYGWPTCEGFCNPPNPSFRDPLYEYAHGDGDAYGRAITGGAFYNPATATFPGQYVGKYFFADYVNGWIHYLNPANNAVAAFMGGVPNLVDLEVGPDGALYYLTIAENPFTDGRGAVRKIQYTGTHAPTIGQQPLSQSAPAGSSVTFEVRASGDQPLNYQWQRNGASIAGATSPTYTIGSVTGSDNGTQFRAVVTNSFGSVTSASASLTVLANNPPAATITAPAAETKYKAGDTINYAGTGTDPEDGNLPASAFTWQVDFHHGDHWHPGFVPAYSGATAGSFTIPTTGETSADVFYRIYLTVKDSAGATTQTSRDLIPYTSTITLATNPSGLQVTLDGSPATSPYSTVGVVGMTRALGVISPQTLNGTTYQFSSWSDGGAATHNISTPGANTTYTANFTVCSTCASPLAASYSSSPPQSWNPGETKTYNVTVTNTGSQTWNAGGTNIVRLGIHFGSASDFPGDGWATDQRFFLPNNVAPGASVTIKASVTAPTAPGTFILRNRMVKENIAWFDQIQKVNAAVGNVLAASYNSSPPTTWSAGQTQAYNVTVTNTGSQMWNAGGTNIVRLGVHFGTASDWPHDGWATDQRFMLPNDVAPGASATIRVNVTAPTAPGNYVLRHRMVKEGVVWFDQIQKANVVVNTAVAASAVGLKATTFANEDFSGDAITRIDPNLSFDSRAGEPLPAQGDGGFSVRWKGQITAPVSGPYTIYTESSDGVRVWINDKLVIDHWDEHATTEDSGKIRLKEGQKYKIKIEYHTKSGAATFKLMWSYKDKAKRVIPKKFLSVE